MKIFSDYVNANNEMREKGFDKIVFDLDLFIPENWKEDYNNFKSRVNVFC
jgi:hypothetical protein